MTEEEVAEEIEAMVPAGARLNLMPLVWLWLGLGFLAFMSGLLR